MCIRDSFTGNIFSFFIIFSAKQNPFPSASMQIKILQHHFFIFFDADRSSAVVGGVLLAARVLCLQTLGAKDIGALTFTAL